MPMAGGWLWPSSGKGLMGLLHINEFGGRVWE